MQQGPQVVWDPITIDHHIPFMSRLLILYLLVLAVVWVVRSVSVLRMFWSLRRGPLALPTSEDDFLERCEVCSRKIDSMKQLAFVTLLWTVLVAALQLRTTLVWLVETKVFLPAALGGGVLDAVGIFIPGILAAAVLYSASILYAGALGCTKESWNRKLRHFRQSV
jgi:hypothetical protein